MSGPMNLTIPAVGLTTGPEYANIINQDLSLIDNHDHTPGNGNQLTPASLNISSDLLFNTHSATDLLSVNFVSQASTLASSVIDAVYVTNGDLYYNNGLGVPVQITLGSALAGTPGSISGLSSPASASYNSGTFTFQSNVNTAANADIGSLVLRNNTVSSKGLTLSAPTLATDVSMVLPPIPASPSFLSIDQFGNMNTAIPLLATLTTANLSPTAGILGTQIAANTITNNNLANPSVSTSTLYDDAVISTKILNGAIVTNKLANAAVTTVKVLDRAITLDKLSNSNYSFSNFSTGIISLNTTVIPVASYTMTPSTNPSFRPLMVTIQGTWEYASGTSGLLYLYAGRNGSLVQLLTYRLGNFLESFSISFVDNTSNPSLSTHSYELWAGVSAGTTNVNFTNGHIMALQP